MFWSCRGILLYPIATLPISVVCPSCLLATQTCYECQSNGSYHGCPMPAFQDKLFFQIKRHANIGCVLYVMLTFLPSCSRPPQNDSLTHFWLATHQLETTALVLVGRADATLQVLIGWSKTGFAAVCKRGNLQSRSFILSDLPSIRVKL